MNKSIKNYLALLFGALLLSGCATTIRSDVTAFHAWPAQIDDKSYRFDAPSQQNDTLEYRSYQGLVRTELDKLGFIEANAPATPELTVAMQFSTTVRPVRVLEVLDPFWNTRGYWHGYYRGPLGYPAFSPFYDPFMYRQPELVETIRDGYERQLEIRIDARDGRKLFDVTVRNSSTIFSTALVMPAMVKSAFVDFPGQSGVPRQIDLKLK